LMKTIMGLIVPTNGQVRTGGVDVTRQPVHTRIGQGVVYLPEGRGIFRSLSVRENIALSASKDMSADVAISLAAEAFPQLGTRMRQIAATLSGGEQQMLAMVQAYLSKPKLLLVDEPSFGLAPRIVDAIFEFLRKVNENGSAVLLVDQFADLAVEMS